MGSNGDSSVPTVDFSPFIHHTSDPEQRLKTAIALAQCCHAHGCAGITGHGVPVELLESAFDMSKKLFDLSLEDKMKAPHPEGMTPHRGYSGLGREQAGAKGALDTDDEGRKEELLKTVDYKVLFSFKVGFYVGFTIGLCGYFFLGEL